MPASRAVHMRMVSATRMKRSPCTDPPQDDIDMVIEAERTHLNHAMTGHAASTDKGETRSTSSTGAEKGVKLARFDLLPQQALHTVAEHYGIGARKYAPNNWRKGYEWSKSFAAMQRHANAFWDGEDLDPETQSPHMAAVAFHALALLTFMQEHPEFDDRFKP